MSRCFPFPPPGYEKKARIDDADLLTKEKHKERKHKKDKRDKEKKEGKEKKDKERSKDKHREKKDRKEKQKDKKKDKDRDKDKNRTLDEKRVEGQPEGYNGEKLGQNSQCAEEIKDSKFVQELGRRIRDNEEKGTRIQMVGNFTGTDQRRAEAMGRVVEKDVDNRNEGKEKNEKKDKKGNDRREGEKRNRVEERGTGIARFHNFTQMDQQRVEGMAAHPLEKDAEKRMDGKEKNKDKGSDSKQGDKRKDREREKKSKGKDKNKEKVKEKSDHKSRGPDKLKESGKEPIDTVNITSHFSKDTNKSSATDGNLRKRKHLEMNGFLHESDTWPNKLPRPASSSHLLAENGRRLEPCGTAIKFTSDRQGAANNHQLDNKERKVNGVIEAQLASVCSAKPLFITAQANENGEASTKPPHPDSKYLRQILSVPKIVEERSDFDDQEWLFSSGGLLSKKPEVGSSGVDETPQVWAEALQIDLADVCALPYVIPY